MDAEDEQSLEERLRAQTNSNSNKPISTRSTTSTVKTSRYTFKDEKLDSHTDKNGVCYRVGDHVYLETNKQAEPYSIACILDFRLTRKDHVMLEVRWYYRPNEIPPNLYHLLIEDRYHENQGNNSTSSIKDKQTKDSGIIQDPNIIGRELFVSEIKEFYPATHIKGRCRVAHYQDIEEARAFKPDPDTFFYILTYNPEARRLANTQGEIRVGPSHQAKLPLLKSFPSSSVANGSNEEICSLREELLWKNKTSDIDLSMYLQAARSIAAFAGMCDRGLPEDMYEVAQRDDTTINALNVLHNHDYDCKRAIQALVKCPIPKGIDRKWSEEDQKKFIKGLRQYGKNFYRIRKEHLPHKETSDLVEFYYLWKKTPQAQSSRPRRRQRPCSTSVNLSTTPTPAKQRNAKNNNKDESEHNSDNDDNGTNETDETFCRHCQTVSKDLQAGGRDSHLLCYDCRMYYKKYGEMPIINQEPSPYLFKPLDATSPSNSNSSASKRKRSKLRQTSPPPATSSSSSSSLPPSASISTEKTDEQNSSQKNSSTTRSRKKTRAHELNSTIKTEQDDEENLKEESSSTNSTTTMTTTTAASTVKIEEQENEKPSNDSSETLATANSGFLIKTEDPSSLTLTQPLPSLITTTTVCKQEINSPSSTSSSTTSTTILSNGAAKIANKILIDHTKQNNNHSMHSPSASIKTETNHSTDSSTTTISSSALQPSLLSSPRSAFSRTSKSSTTPQSLSQQSPDLRRSIKEEIDSPSSSRSHISKSTPTIHPTILSGDVIPSSNTVPPPLIIPSTSNENKDNDLPLTDINDDGNTSDSSTNGNQEPMHDNGPMPLSCERECYNKSQGIVLLQVYDRSMSQNSCARTDIILKRNSRTRKKPSTNSSTTVNEEKPDIPSLPTSTPATLLGMKPDQNLSKLPFLSDKAPPMLHPSAPPPFPPLNHHDPLLMARPTPLFPPHSLYSMSPGPKPPGTAGPPPLNFSVPPFGPSPHDNVALRHLDPLALRLMNPAAAAAAAAQLYGGVGRSNPVPFDPATAAMFFDQRYRSMMTPFGATNPATGLPPTPSSNSSSSSNNTGGTHNHAHIHSHSHTHLHLGNNNDSSSTSSTNNSNGPSLAASLAPPQSMLPFVNPMSSLSHGGPLLHPSAGPPPPHPSSMSSLEAMHNLSRERDFMTYMLATNGGRFDPMALALSNSLQMPRHDDLSRLNARERSIREHNENELRRLNMDVERQQQQLRFPFHHPTR